MAMTTQPRTRQIINEAELRQLIKGSTKQLDNLLLAANAEMTQPLAMRESATPNLVLNIGPILVQNPQTLKYHTISPIKGVLLPAFTGATITLPSVSGGTITNSAGASAALTIASGKFKKMVINLLSDGTVLILLGSDAASVAAANASIVGASGFTIGHFIIRNVGGTIQNVTEEYIYQYGGGGGGSSSSATGSGSELIDMGFKFRLADTFDGIPDVSGTNSVVDIGSNKTDVSIYDTANQLYKLNFDSSKTVTAGGSPFTSMALSANITQFTPKAGDILIFGSEARRITTWTSYSNFVVESAFTTNPSTSVCCISQCVYTLDINNYDAAGTGLSAYSQITDALDQVYVQYDDSQTSGDIIPDYSSAALVGFTISADGTTYSGVKTRVTGINTTDAAVNFPTSGTNFYTRFFANKIGAGGAGTVNLLGIRAYWQREYTSALSNYNLAAWAWIDGAQYSNVSHLAVNGKSRFTFTSPYPRGVDPTNPSGSGLWVYANGQRVPRYYTSKVDTSQAYFTEISDSIIEMDTDYTGLGIDFQFIVPATVIDTNTQNTTRLANLEQLYGFRNKIINGNFDIWQRNTALSSGSGARYLADRWRNDSSGTTYTASRQSFTVGQTDVSNEPQYYHRAVVTSSAGSGNYACLYQPIEDVRTLSNKTVTATFYAKADSAKNIAVELAQYPGSGGSATISGIGVTTCALTSSWKKFTVTASIPSLSGKTIGTDNFFGLFFWFDGGSALNSRTNSLGQQSGTFDIAQVQLEEGPVATPFEQRPLTLESQLCLRYCYVPTYWAPLGGTTNYYFQRGVTAGTSATFILNHLVPMRGLTVISAGVAGTAYDIINQLSGATLAGTTAASLSGSSSEIQSSVIVNNVNTVGTTFYLLRILTSGFQLSAEF